MTIQFELEDGTLTGIYVLHVRRNKMAKLVDRAYSTIRN